MVSLFRSIWTWTAVTVLVIVWLPLLVFVRAFDRDPVRYRTGRWFRRLGVAMCRVNPSWRIHLSGEHIQNPRKPYVVISNHQSHADIPILSNLPWEMKWIAKKALFTLPFVGWMMRLAGDIPVDRADRRSGARMLLTAMKYLDRKCSVIFFPEGTRSPDGRVGRFNDGAFHLAIKAHVPILPIAIEGSYDCLPKRSWKFGRPSDVRVRVMPEVSTEGLTTGEAGLLNGKVRRMIVEQVAAFRRVTPSEVDVSNSAMAPVGP
jgi:1-acyl-sn-glycerol-3-phosphate acyltransferase